MSRAVLVVIAAVAAVFLFSSVYTVSETEQVILVQFGRPVGGVVTEPGLHAKLPLIQVVHRFDKRWLEFDGDANEIPTKDRSTSGSTPTPAGGSRTLCASSRPCATSAAARAGSTTSWTARPAMRSPPTI